MACACNSGVFRVTWKDASGETQTREVSTKQEASAMARRNEGTYQKVS